MLTLLALCLATEAAPKARKVVEDVPDPRLAALPNLQILNVPTYDGSGQAVHPDVAYFRDGYRGHFFYMAVTPYPLGNSAFENPSVLVSENGVDWREEVAGLNPMVPTPPSDHNDDPDLSWNPATQEFLLHYLETRRFPFAGAFQDVKLLRSPDGVSWQLSTALHYDLVAGDPFILSPALVRKGNASFLFYVNASTAPYRIEYLESPDGRTWDKKAIHLPVANFPRGFTPWHVDVFGDGRGWYYMLCNGYTGVDFYDGHDLYLARSQDLTTWEVCQDPILKTGRDLSDARCVYRSTGVVDPVGGLLAVWFSYPTPQEIWKVGVAKFKLADRFPVAVTPVTAPTAPNLYSVWTSMRMGQTGQYAARDAWDPDAGTTLTYTFDWGDGSSLTPVGPTNQFGPGIGVGPYHTWTAPGTWFIRCKVTDNTGLSSPWSAPLVVTVSP